MSPASEFRGRRVVVTGAGRGIGAAILRRFLAEGAETHAIDIAFGESPEAPGAKLHRLDLTDAEGVAALFARIGPVDVLINGAAAVTRQTKITDLGLEEWQTCLDVNLTAVFLACRAALPGMQARGAGNIVNIASQLSVVALPDRAAYCATKGAIVAFSKALALDHAEDGIRVNTLSPGAVATERVLDRHGTLANAEAAMSGRYPLGRIGRPDEVAEAALFLASGRSGFMTGSNLVLDGGYTIQ